MIKKILSIPFSVVALVLCFLWLGVFHIIQFVTHRLFGYEAHKRSVDALNFFLLKSLYALFITSEVEFRADIPTGKPIIFAANHQGLFDIISMGWYLRKYHPKYVSKIELGKGIPSVSYNLQHGGSAIIDRKDPKQALPALKNMGEYIQQYNRSVVIYPEGTRSRDGRPGEFASNGLKILCKYAPDALVVPVTINNSWKIFRYGGFPFGMGTKLQVIAHEPIAIRDFDFNTVFEKTEKAIVGDIRY
jgi:1-acyl-sn-glycerol-3-phosphate acyltransferase